MKLPWIALGLLLISASSSADSIGHLAVVEPGLYRGARPSREGLATLQSLGVRAILNLEDDPRAVSREKSVAATLGIQEISIPFSGFWAPRNSKVDHVLRVLSDPSNRPLFVHCQHGEDRTGLIIGLYRVEVEGWSAADAHHEMLQNGFHELLIFLQEFFEYRIRRLPVQ